MAVPATCNDFVDVVRDSGLVEEPALKAFLTSNSAAGSDTKALAEEMCKAGLITRFQMALLLQGLRRGYFIADKFMVLEQLGSGGMGKVYLCRHKVMRHEVAVKVLPNSFAKNPEYVDRFLREARAAAALNHPNIVRAFDVDKDEKVYYLVMEYVEGSSLQQLVAQRGPLKIKRAASYISQAAAGLQHASDAGLVHRDIKPANLLVDRNHTVKILDMGLAMFFQEQGKGLTQQYDANAILGTADYLAPEQAIDSQGVDIRADIYSLGMTFYFLLTGKSPYGEEGTIAQKLIWHQVRTPKPIREVRPEVPPEVAAVIDKMLAKKPEDRYQQPREVVDALAWCVNGNSSGETMVRARREANALAGPETAIDASADDSVDTKISSGASGKQSSKTRNESGSGRVEADRPSSKKLREDKAARKKPRREDDYDDEEEDEEDFDDRPKRSKGRSGKHKRAKAGFWTPAKILIASGGGVFLLLVMGLVIWAMSGDSGGGDRGTTPIAKGTPTDGTQPNVQPKGTDNNPPRINPLTPDPVDKQPKTNTDGQNKGNPNKKDDAKKQTPAKKNPPNNKNTPAKNTKKTPPGKKTDTAKKNVPPKTKTPNKSPRNEALTDYYPTAGVILFYDVAQYPPNGKGAKVLRQRWQFQPASGSKNDNNGIITASIVRIGELTGQLSKGAKVSNWKDVAIPPARAYFRRSKTHVEYSTTGRDWEPILPLRASVKDTWKRQVNGQEVEYTLENFGNFSGGKSFKGNHKTVTIRAVEKNGNMTTTMVRTYAKDIGEVSRTETIGTGSNSRVTLEARLVDE